jgi:hypothetical protein
VENLNCRTNKIKMMKKKKKKKKMLKRRMKKKLKTNHVSKTKRSYAYIAYTDKTVTYYMTHQSSRQAGHPTTNKIQIVLTTTNI